MQRPPRWRRLVAAAALCFLLAPNPSAYALPDQPAARAWKVEAAPGLSAGAAVVLDWETGEILYQRDAHRRRDPASTTKVLTGLIALERGQLEDQVRISRRAARTPGSSMYIKEGEVYSLHDLLYGLLLRSGNDAAVAIAEHLAGSVEEFATWMNARAQEMGLRNSHFTNPHGLTDGEHWSSAYDLAVITRHAMANPTFAAIVAKREAPLTFEAQNRGVILYNTNRLLSMIAGADGVKTGTTAAAGNCLVASATRDEQKVIAVVLNASNRWNDSARLLEWAFRNFQLVHLGREGEVVRHAPVRRGRLRSVPLQLSGDLAIVMERKGMIPPSVELQVQDTIEAPVQKGQPLGVAIVRDETGARREQVLVAGTYVPRWTWVDILRRVLGSLIPSLDEE